MPAADSKLIPFMTFELLFETAGKLIPFMVLVLLLLTALVRLIFSAFAVTDEPEVFALVNASAKPLPEVLVE